MGWSRLLSPSQTLSFEQFCLVILPVVYCAIDALVCVRLFCILFQRTVEVAEMSVCPSPARLRNSTMCS